MKTGPSISTLLILAEAKPTFVCDKDVIRLAAAYRKLQAKLRAANKKIKNMKAEWD